MYDIKSEPNEFIADTPEEALAKACQFFGSEEAALKVVHVKEGVIYGLGGRAVVVAVPKDAASRPRSEGRREERGRSEGRREERGRGGRDSRGGSRRPAPAESSEEVEAAPADEPIEESKGSAEGAIGPIGEFVLGAVERMGLGAFGIAESKEGDFIVYQLTGNAAARLASDGRAVDALQLLANQAEMRLSDEPRRIVVDVEGEGERQEEFLTRLTDRAAQRASDSGRAVALDPMNGRDRRIVHMAVRDLEGVVTMSVGEGRYRQVVIVPEGAPEYEKARADSERAESQP